VLVSTSRTGGVIVSVGWFVGGCGIVQPAANKTLITIIAIKINFMSNPPSNPLKTTCPLRTL
jgi:hypothetical protein